MKQGPTMSVRSAMLPCLSSDNVHHEWDTSVTSIARKHSWKEDIIEKRYSIVGVLFFLARGFCFLRPKYPKISTNQISGQKGHDINTAH